MMLMPSPIWSVAFIVWVAGGAVPNLDVSTSCRGAAEASLSKDRSQDLTNSCIHSEQNTRSELEKAWSTFSGSDKAWCTSTVRGFAPTYTELAACLEMKKALADMKKNNSQSGQSTNGPTTNGMGPGTRP
jgi:hypothetical protein